MKLRTQTLLRALDYLWDGRGGVPDIGNTNTEFTCCAITTFGGAQMLQDVGAREEWQAQAWLARTFYIYWLLGDEGAHWYADEPQLITQAERATALCFAAAISETEE